MSNKIQIKYSDIIENQATINILTCGHVAHGKSTVVKAVTGVKTQKHRAEEKRNITINLGYANAKIYKCRETGKLVSYASDVPGPTNKEGSTYDLVMHISFVDAPGHEALMSTMISGTNNVDVMFLLIAGNDPVMPQAQTVEHLLALSAVHDLKNLVILHNKLDLISREEAIQNLAKIHEFIDNTAVKNAPIIPISAQIKTNMEVIYDYLHNINVQIKDYNKPAYASIIRSFNVNKPNTTIDTITGGVVGGSLKRGHLKIGDIVEIRPGIVMRDQAEKDPSKCFKCYPLISEVKSIHSEKNALSIAVSGGLLGIGLTIDPGLTKNNNLVGHIVGHIGTLPDMYSRISVLYSSLNRSKNKKTFKKGEKVNVCVHSTNSTGSIIEVDIKQSTTKSGKTKKQINLTIQLDNVICFDDDESIIIMTRQDNKWKVDGTVKILEKIAICSDNIILPEKYQEYLENQRPSELEIIYDLPIPDQSLDIIKKIKESYNEMLDNIQINAGNNKDNNFTMVSPNIIIVNKQSVLINFMSYCEAFNFYKGDNIPEHQLLNPKDMLIQFISSEASTQCNLNGENQLILNGKFRPEQIEHILSNYVKEYLYCSNCKTINSYLYRNKQLNYKYCNHCNSTRTF